MECPVKHHGFARLPGQTQDNGGRALRELLEKDTGALLEKLFLEYASERSTYSYDHRVVVYATASFVIEVLWKYITSEESVQELATLCTLHATGSYEDRVQGFMRCSIDHLNNTIRTRFVDDVSARLKAGDLTKEDKLYLVFVGAQRKDTPEGRGLPVPSFNDLVVLMGRMALVIPEVFLRDVGRLPEHGEVFAMMRNSHMIGFLSELMSNARHTTLPLVACLQGTRKGDLDTLEYRFNPKFFKVEYVVGRPSVKVSESFAGVYRGVVGEVASRSTSLPSTLGCPVLYTGKMRDMYPWFCTAFEAWITA